MDDQPIDQDLDGAAQPHAGPGGRVPGLVAWTVSGSLHATAVMLMATIVFMSKSEDIDAPPVRTVFVPPPTDRPVEKPQPNRDLRNHEFTVNVETRNVAEVPETPINPLQVDIARVDTSEDVVETNLKKGREEAVSVSETGGQAAFMAIGVGGGGSGLIGHRIGGDRKRTGQINGASQASENAVEAALRWFRRHQSPNGSWDAERYFANCAQGARCEPGSLFGHSAAEVNTAMTGYAVLCFLGAGYDHQNPNKHRQTVRKGIDWLLSTQKPDGQLGSRNYEHAVATMALAEAYAMSNDPALRLPAQRAVDIILQRQNRDASAAAASAGGVLGWDYVGPSTRNDASVTGWNVMALKSAHIAGLNTGSSLKGAARWLELAWKAANDGGEGRPDWRAMDSYGKTGSAFSYTWPTGATAFDAKGFGHRNMAPVAMASAVFLGHHAQDPMLESLATWVVKNQTPAAYPCNTYYLYYNTLGMFQVGGERWEQWNGGVRDLLVAAQRRDMEGCVDGSWDWQGTGFHGHEIGRVLSTAYLTLSLEVYYRYDQISGKPRKEGRAR